MHIHINIISSMYDSIVACCLICKENQTIVSL